MTTTVPRCWQHLPRLPSAMVSMRNVVARLAQSPRQGWFEHDGMVFQLTLAERLSSYSVFLTLDGGAGRLYVWLECGSILPQLSADILDGVDSPEARVDALEWLLMPWLESLESLTGCELRVTNVMLRHAPWPRSPLTLAASLRDGRRAHLAAAGPALAVIAEHFAPAQTSLPGWCRVQMAWLLRVPGLVLREMRALTRGALLRTTPNILQIQLGQGVRMAAHWKDDEYAEVDGLVQSEPLASPGWSESQPLVALGDMTFDVDVVLSTQELTLDQVSGLCEGVVMPISRPVTGERVALVHRGVTFARGELAYVEDELVVMITECTGSGDR